MFLLDKLYSVHFSRAAGHPHKLKRKNCHEKGNSKKWIKMNVNVSDLVTELQYIDLLRLMY